MEHHTRTREALVKRRDALRLRIDRVESIAQAAGFACGREVLGLKPNPILQHFLAGTVAEAAKADSALRRLDRREFNSCIMCGGDIDPSELERHPYTVDCDRCSRRFPKTYADDVRIQHSDLYGMWMALLEAVSRACSRVAVELPLDTEVCACHAIADCLCLELNEHFANEEKGGYLKSALRAAPQFERQAGVLKGQHADFSRRLAKVREDLPGTVSLPLPWSQVQLDLQDLVKELIDHEESENGILSAAFLDDLGGEG